MYGAKKILSIALVLGLMVSGLSAQDRLPEDRGMATYYTAPRYRESESHPFRILGYILHPIGWALREGIFRPLSYFASSTEESRSVMGYREPFDFRGNECFSQDMSVPDCRTILPFNYEGFPSANTDAIDQGTVNSEDMAMANQ